MRTLWGRLAATLDFGVRQRFTRTGLAFTLTCVLVALAAFASANNLVFLILAAMLATLLVSGFISRLSLAGLELDFLLPEHISASRTLLGRIVVRNAKRWMPSLSIHLAASSDGGLLNPLYFPVIVSGSILEEPVELHFKKRGSYRENRFRFSTRFPFGFTERRINVVLRREIIVYPSVDPHPGFEALLAALDGDIQSLYRGMGSDFYRIRPYEALESARHVDWRATAHTGDLQVREFAREQERAIALFLDIEVPDDAAEFFERAVDCCAFLAWSMHQRGNHVRFCTQEAIFESPDENDIYTILKYLALVTPSRGRTFSAPSLTREFQVLFSAAPDRLARAGWILESSVTRVLRPDNMPGVAVVPGSEPSAASTGGANAGSRSSSVTSA